MTQGDKMFKVFSRPQIDLNDSIFQTNYNVLIPGDSGSGDPTFLPLINPGGHPKFRVGASSSFDFYFPSFELDGSIPTENATFIYTPYSGSTLDVSNGSFISQNNSNGMVQLHSYSGSRDGTIDIDYTSMELFATLNPQNPGNIDDITINDVYIRPRIKFTADSNLNITSSWQYILAPPTSNAFWLTVPLKLGNFSYGNGVGEWDVSPSGYTTIASILQPADNVIYFRPVIKSPETQYEYTMTEYDLDLKFDVTAQYDGGALIQETHTISNAYSSTGQNGINNDMFPIYIVIKRNRHGNP